MKKFLLVILALPLCIALVMSMFSRTEPGRMTFTGEVVQVDEMAQTISAKDSLGIEVFDTTDAVFDEGYDTETVQPGDVVEIEYEEREGSRKAVAVMLKIAVLEPENPPYAMESPEERAPIQSPARAL